MRWHHRARQWLDDSRDRPKYGLEVANPVRAERLHSGPALTALLDGKLFSKANDLIVDLR